MNMPLRHALNCDCDQCEEARYEASQCSAKPNPAERWELWHDAQGRGRSC